MSANLSPAVPTMSPRGGSAGLEPKAFSWQDTGQRNAWLAAVASAVALVWAYWMMFKDAAEFWDQPQYSHGWILPLISLVMMWSMRPSKAVDATHDLAIKCVGGACVSLIALGQFSGSLSFLQGIGLAVACVGGFACCLWNQPFAGLVDSETKTYRFGRPDVLWGVTVVGCLISAIGLLGIRVGPVSPDVFSMLGLLVLIVGIVLTAVIVSPSPVVSWNEIAAGTAVMLFCTFAWASGIKYDRMPIAQVSFIATAIGVLTIIGGMHLVRWAGPAVAFLLFMFPLPTFFERKVLGLLQTIAVVLSEMVYTLMGVTAIRSGNQISLPGLNDFIDMEIAEACSGLSMTNILVAMCMAFVILAKRPWWDRLILFLSAIPIALISNVFRIVLTGLIWMAMDYFTGGKAAPEMRDTLHTWIGLLVMMPFALGLLVLELKVLSMLSVPEESTVQQGGMLGRSAGPPIR